VRMKTSMGLILISVLLIVMGMAGCVPYTKGKILFQSDRDGANNLYVMNADGSDQRNLTGLHCPMPTGRCNSIGFVFASPDGKQVAISLNVDEDKKSEIYLINIGNGARSNLSKNLGSADVFTWSPDGKQIAFVSDQDAVVINSSRALSTNNIYVMEADGTQVRRLTVDNTTNQYGMLSWSPDGKRLVFDMSSELSWGGFFSVGIHLMSISDGKLTALTRPSGIVADDPIWSPDGKHILYDAGTASNNLYVMNADGTDQVALAINASGWLHNASWSPDGKKIVFSALQFQAPCDKCSYIYVVNADGTNLIDLSKDSLSHDTEPSWSPDGKYIVFASRQDNSESHLYIMSADGANQKQLTNGPGEESTPIWLPTP
jgi:TolB protein